MKQTIREFPLILGMTRYGLMLYNPEDGCAGHGFHRYGEYSETEVEIFRQYKGRGELALDIGANIGAHSLALSHIFKEVCAFEREPVLARFVRANMALNDVSNVQVFEGAAQESLQSLKAGLLPDFIKLDVDGPELEILDVLKPVIEVAQPVLYVENDVPETGDAKIEYICRLGYRPFWHLAGLYQHANFGREALQPSDIGKASMMLLCLPPGELMPPPGLLAARPGDAARVMKRITPEDGSADYLVMDLGVLL